MKRIVRGTAVLLIAGGLSHSARTAELIVAVTGIRSDAGEVGCALFSSPQGFPLNLTGAAQRWLPARQSGVTCRFPDLKPGVYAVAVGHNVNVRHRVETNFLGMPTEDWGVSNDVRPTLRAPRFEEAAVQLNEGGPDKITVRVAP